MTSYEKMTIKNSRVKEIEKQKNRKIREAKGLFDTVPFLVPEKIQKN